MNRTSYDVVLSLDLDRLSVRQDSDLVATTTFRVKTANARAPLLQPLAPVTIPIVESEQTTRRKFCAHACQAVSLAALGAVLQGCGGSPTSPSGSAPALPTAAASIVGGTLVLTIDASSPLSPVGGAVLVETSAGRFLVAHTGTDAFVAVTAVCTHEGCTITGFSNQIYVCPCHGSRFNTSGGVVSGPASQSLRRFTAQFANNTLTITV